MLFSINSNLQFVEIEALFEIFKKLSYPRSNSFENSCTVKNTYNKFMHGYTYALME